MDTKFNIADKVFAINVGHKLPFAIAFVIKGVAVRDGQTFYTSDSLSWIPETSIFTSRKEVYNHIINQCESALYDMAHVQRFTHPEVIKIMEAREAAEREREKQYKVIEA